MRYPVSAISVSNLAFTLLVISVAFMPLQGQGAFFYVFPKLSLVAALVLIMLNTKVLLIPKVTWWFVGFILIALVSSMVSEFRQEALRSWVTVLLCLPVYLLSYNVFLRMRSKQVFFILGLGVITLFYAYGYMVFNVDLEEFGIGGRFQGITGNPNSLATFALLTVLTAIVYSVITRSALKKGLFALFALFFLAILLSTGSRKFIIYLVVAIAILPVFMLNNRKTLLSFVVGLVLIVIIGFISLNYFDYEVLERRFQAEVFGAGMSSRIDLYLETFTMTSSSLFIGHGIGTNTSSAHGQIPEILFTSGALGLLSLMAFYFFIGLRLLVKWRFYKSNLQTIVDIILFITVIMMFAGFHYYDSPFHFLVMGYLTASANSNYSFNEEHRIEDNTSL